MSICYKYMTEGSLYSIERKYGRIKMTKNAIVKEIKDGKTYVEADRESSCEACRGKDACLNKRRTVVAQVINDVGAKPGDRVEISTSDGRVLLYSFLTFFIPVFFGIAAYFFIPLPDSWRYAAVISVIIITLIFMASFVNKHAKRENVSRISAVLSSANAVDVQCVINESENIDDEKTQKMEHRNNSRGG